MEWLWEFIICCDAVRLTYADISHSFGSWFFNTAAAFATAVHLCVLIYRHHHYHPVYIATANKNTPLSYPPLAAMWSLILLPLYFATILAGFILVAVLSNIEDYGSPSLGAIGIVEDTLAGMSLVVTLTLFAMGFKIRGATRRAAKEAAGTTTHQEEGSDLGLPM